MDPGREGSPALEGGEATPDLEEGVLDRIFGVIAIVENLQGRGQRPRSHRNQQLVEGRAIAGLGPVDEFVDTRFCRRNA